MPEGPILNWGENLANLRNRRAKELYFIVHFWCPQIDLQDIQASQYLSLIAYIHEFAARCQLRASPSLFTCCKVRKLKIIILGCPKDTRHEFSLAKSERAIA